MKRKREIFIENNNDPASGLAHVNWQGNKIRLENENLETIWEKTQTTKIDEVKVRLGNFGKTSTTLEIKLNNGKELIYSNTGSLLKSSINDKQVEFPILNEEFPAPVLLSRDLKSGYYAISVETLHQEENYQLYDMRGMCIYTGSKQKANFKIRIFTDEVFQLKSYDQIKITGIEIKEIAEEKVIHLLGDSIVANHNHLPYWGWGQLLGAITQKIVVNHGIPGRSTKSFCLEGRFEKVLNESKPNDLALIAFGHNDEKLNFFGTTPEEYVQNIKEMKEQLENKGLKVYISTPIVRRNYVDGKLIETHQKYLTHLYEHFPNELIDLNLYSKNLVNNLGEEKSKEIFIHNEILKIKDNTHLSFIGAQYISQEIIKLANLAEKRNDV